MLKCLSFLLSLCYFKNIYYVVFNFFLVIIEMFMAYFKVSQNVRKKVFLSLEQRSLASNTEFLQIQSKKMTQITYFYKITKILPKELQM